MECKKSKEKPKPKKIYKFEILTKLKFQFSISRREKKSIKDNYVIRNGKKVSTLKEEREFIHKTQRLRIPNE